MHKFWLYCSKIKVDYQIPFNSYKPVKVFFLIGKNLTFGVCVQLQTKLGKVLSQLSDETEMNKSLMKNQSQWQTKVTDLEAAMLQKDKVCPAVILNMHVGITLFAALL